MGQVKWTAGELAAFANVFIDGEGGGSVDRGGSAEILYLDDDQICVAATVTSESGNAFEGVYLAPIVDDI